MTLKANETVLYILITIVSFSCLEKPKITNYNDLSDFNLTGKLESRMFAMNYPFISFSDTGESVKHIRIYNSSNDVVSLLFNRIGEKKWLSTRKIIFDSGEVEEKIIIRSNVIFIVHVSSTTNCIRSFVSLDQAGYLEYHDFKDCLGDTTIDNLVNEVKSKANVIESHRVEMDKNQITVTSSLVDRLSSSRKKTTITCYKKASYSSILVFWFNRFYLTSTDCNPI